MGPLWHSDIYQSAFNNDGHSACPLVTGVLSAKILSEDLSRKTNGALNTDVAIIISHYLNIISATLLETEFLLNFNFIALSLLVGFICYGVSLIFFVLALRSIGTARTSAYFSATPFIGALFAIIFLKELFQSNLVWHRLDSLLTY